MNQRLSRRGFLKLGLGAAAGAAGAQLFFGGRAGMLSPVVSAQTEPITPRYYLAGTDGWASLPGVGNTYFYPDPWAPEGKTSYMFGFADVTQHLSDPELVSPNVLAYKEKAQISAPIMYFDELDPNNPNKEAYVVRLTNLGLAVRPDLVDSHTVHWHGFRNVIPMFDGEPGSSVAVPIGRVFDYAYYPYEPGTYMYHCHFEDTEHVHMGMVGLVFVRPMQNRGAGSLKASRVAPTIAGLYTPDPTGPMGYAYNDGDGSTAYDREYSMFLSEVWNESHWDDAHIQLPDWTDYKADFYLLNGRVYPDTLLPNYAPVGAPTGGVAGDLGEQPYGSLVTCNAGERVLLRFANLGFTQASMTLAGIRMLIVGMDAVMLRGKTGVSGFYETNTFQIGAGESTDAIFTAPAFSGGAGSSGQGYDTYLLYNRNIAGISNNGEMGIGGQMTEVRVYPAGSVPQQLTPHDL
ncbi:multicopper oxidase domain-containing protein [Oscillochloris sp. ZM17-4]|uniref:multicopper oxidase domain-containing protein n=1 Tax=Oscillochloris sp. ZM17-4 TaxID=2866714 RepID=UPI001C735DE5|nr:multicopper oxidase domain-containing protein [Oscillochloris sp. ZM17-4]MBX0329230.1 multicopper oxidase domain-containing protein [Oscillochloris sp. ZM17-4]